MSFSAYPEYKDSGVSWLGYVPAHWDVFSLKRSVEGCTNGIWGNEPDSDNDVAVIRVADFNRSALRIGLGKLTYRSVTQNEYGPRALKRGDLLIEKSGGGDKTLVGCVVLFDHEFKAVSSNFVARMRPYSGFDSNFLCYCFDSLYQGRVNYPAIKQTTGIQNLDSEAYLQERFCFPDFSEQIQIARFLDHETAKIDALIHEQQRLIELLQEKRQAVISHAVTKGLDPDVPMKDSGVEWLGEVPAHWDVKRIKHAVTSIEQGWSPQCDNGPVQTSEEFGVLKVGCVNRGLFRSDENKRLPADIPPKPELSVKADDLLVSRANTRELVGNAAVSTVDYPRLLISDKLYRLRLDPSLAIPHYVSFFLGTPLARHEIELDASGASSSMLNIGQKTILEMPLPCPPVSEQVEIRDEIIKQTYQLLSLSRQATNLMSYLQERRSALISAAVTGTIDVRNWQPPADESAYDEEVRKAGMEATD